MRGTHVSLLNEYIQRKSWKIRWVCFEIRDSNKHPKTSWCWIILRVETHHWISGGTGLRFWFDTPGSSSYCICFMTISTKLQDQGLWKPIGFPYFSADFMKKIASFSTKRRVRNFHTGNRLQVGWWSSPFFSCTKQLQHFIQSCFCDHASGLEDDAASRVL